MCVLYRALDEAKQAKTINCLQLALLQNNSY